MRGYLGFLVNRWWDGRGRRPIRPTAGAALRLEALEDRRLLSTAVGPQSPPLLGDPSQTALVNVIPTASGQTNGPAGAANSGIGSTNVIVTQTTTPTSRQGWQTVYENELYLGNGGAPTDPSSQGQPPSSQGQPPPPMNTAPPTAPTLNSSSASSATPIQAATQPTANAAAAASSATTPSAARLTDDSTLENGAQRRRPRRPSPTRTRPRTIRSPTRTRPRTIRSGRPAPTIR